MVHVKTYKLYIIILILKQLKDIILIKNMILYQGGITIEIEALQISKDIKTFRNHEKYLNIKMIFVGPSGYSRC